MIKGVALSLSASVLFGVMYFYSSLLLPLTGEQIFGWRMLLTVPVMTVFVLAWGEWHQVIAILITDPCRHRREPHPADGE